MPENDLVYGEAYFLMINGKKEFQGIYVGNKPERTGIRHFILVRESGTPCVYSFLTNEPSSSFIENMIEMDTIRLPKNAKKSYVNEREANLADKLLSDRGL